MAMGFSRGTETGHERKLGEFVRDTRTGLARFKEFLRSGAGTGTVLGCAAIMAWQMPAVADLALLTGLGFFTAAMRRKPVLPLRLPKQAAVVDANYPLPNGSPRKAQGIMFLGNDRRTGDELWVTNDDLRQHCLVLGTTGAGKTVTLLSMATNAIAWGSGFIYVDAKADNGLVANVYSMLKRAGREDDLLVLNYMTSGGRQSNTFNPFATGSADSLRELVVSQLESGGSSGDMWKGRAISLITAVLPVCVWLRDHKGIPLDVDFLRLAMELESVMAFGAKRVILGRGPSRRELDFPDMPDTVCDPLLAYLGSLPGYKKNTEFAKQSGTALEQHSYLSMQFSRVFGQLAETLGHIYRASIADIDLYDVIVNRRILIVLIPALENSPDTNANLGKIVVAAIKDVMARCLGTAIEGNFKEVVGNRPTNAPAPIFCFLDEVGAFATPGMGMMAAQGRSLGFSFWFASQDIPGLRKLLKEEADQIVANCNLKLFMRLEDQGETWKLAEASAGRAYVVKSQGYQGDSNATGVAYRDGLGGTIQEVSRISWLDVKSQSEGEAHILLKDQLVRATMLYAPAKSPEVIRCNQLLALKPPTSAEAAAVLEGLTSRLEILRRGLENVAAAPVRADAHLSAALQGWRRAAGLAGADRAKSSLGTVAALVGRRHKSIVAFVGASLAARPPAPPMGDHDPFDAAVGTLPLSPMAMPVANNSPFATMPPDAVDPGDVGGDAEDMEFNGEDALHRAGAAGVAGAPEAWDEDDIPAAAGPGLTAPPVDYGEEDMGPTSAGFGPGTYEDMADLVNAYQASLGDEARTGVPAGAADLEAVAEAQPERTGRPNPADRVSGVMEAAELALGRGEAAARRAARVVAEAAAEGLRYPEPPGMQAKPDEEVTALLRDLVAGLAAQNEEERR